MKKADSSEPVPNLYSELLTEAAEAPSYTVLINKVLRRTARWFRCPYAAVHVRHAAEVVQDDCHFGPADPSFWKKGLQGFLTDVLGEEVPRARVLQSKKGKIRVAYLSMPVFDRSQGVIGAMAFVLTPVEESQLPAYLAMLDAAGRLISLCEASVHRPGSEKDLQERSDRACDARAPTSAMARAEGFATIEELAFSISNELRNKYGFEQVSLGWVDRERIRVIAISGLDRINRKSPGVINLTATMEECLDAGKVIGFQNDGEDLAEDAVYHLHKQWHVAVKGESVASIPLTVNNRTLAILSLRNRADRPFTMDLLREIRSRVEPFAPALELTRRASRSVVRHLRDSLRAAAHATLLPGWHTKKLCACVLPFLILAMVFVSLPYQLAVPCVVSADGIRTIAAPVAGVLTEAPKMKGDLVKKGDVLCRFDRRTLDDELRKIESERRVLVLERDRAIAEDAPVESQLARAKLQLLDARYRIAQHRAEQSTIVAPFDGVVITGDQRKKIGSLIARGETLFEISPMHRWRLELEVAQGSIGEVEAGLKGIFITHARPDAARPFRLNRVPPATQLQGGRTVFVAEADIDARDDWLRPGMDGVAKINLGRRPLWWQLFHGPMDYLRLKFWM